jgi:hypothetical protein
MANANPATASGSESAASDQARVRAVLILIHTHFVWVRYRPVYQLSQTPWFAVLVRAIIVTFILAARQSDAKL